MTVEQGVAVFNCQHDNTDDITWRLNGTTRSSLNYTKVTLSDGRLKSSLLIQTHLHFNRTTIECVAVFLQGSPPFLFTSPVTLLVQGMVNRSI